MVAEAEVPRARSAGGGGGAKIPFKHGKKRALTAVSAEIVMSLK